MVYVNLDDGYVHVVREMEDQMGFNGMAEIFLCLYEQYPDISR